MKTLHKTADALQALSHALDCLTLHGLANRVRLVVNHIDAAAYRQDAKRAAKRAARSAARSAAR